MAWDQNTRVRHARIPAGEGARLARRSGDAEGRIARGAGGIWDGFDGNTAFEWLRAETRERPCVASKDETSTRRITIYGTTYWFGLFSRFMTHHRGSERFCHTAKKIISHVGLSDEYEYPRAESAPPCGARPCTNPFFAPSRAILVTMAIETVRARLSREPEPRVPRAFPAAHPVFSSASHPGGSVPTRAGQRARTRGARRARGAPRRGLRARRRVLRRDRTKPAADSLARPTFPSPPRSIPPRRHRHIVTHIR